MFMTAFSVCMAGIDSSSSSSTDQNTYACSVTGFK